MDISVIEPIFIDNKRNQTNLEQGTNKVNITEHSDGDAINSHPDDTKQENKRYNKVLDKKDAAIIVNNTGTQPHNKETFKDIVSKREKINTHNSNGITK